jgi:hypothetical protein
MLVSSFSVMTFSVTCNLIAARVAILDFSQCRLLKVTKYSDTIWYLKKYSVQGVNINNSSSNILCRNGRLLNTRLEF